MDIFGHRHQSLCLLFDALQCSCWLWRSVQGYAEVFNWTCLGTGSSNHLTWTTWKRLVMSIFAEHWIRAVWSQPTLDAILLLPGWNWASERHEEALWEAWRRHHLWAWRYLRLGLQGWSFPYRPGERSGPQETAKHWPCLKGMLMINQ